MNLNKSYECWDKSGKPTEEVEIKLDEADRQAASTTERLSHQDVFDHVRRIMDEQ